VREEWGKLVMIFCRTWSLSFLFCLASFLSSQHPAAGYYNGVMIENMA
jgi:hypothetical protein